MNIKKLFALVLAFVLACNLSTVSAADKAPKQNNQPVTPPTPVVMSKPAVKKQDDRYQVVGDFVPLDKVGFTQPMYSGQEILNGLGMKTAGELGIAGKLVYNEYEHTARIVRLHPSAPVYYDTGSLEPLYLGGCIRNGKSFANRLKLVEQKTIAKPVSVTVPQPQVSVPTAKSVVQEKRGTAGSVYEVEFKTAKSQIVVVPSSRLLPTVVVVDVSKPRVSANGCPLNTDQALTPADGYLSTQ